MIDLASFYTVPLPSTSTTEAGNDKGTPQQGGLGIFDLLLTQLEQQLANGDGENGSKGEIKGGDKGGDNTNVAQQLTQKTAGNSTLNTDTRRSLLRVLAGNDTVAGDVAHLDEMAELDLIEEIEQTLALNQRLFDNVIKAGTGNDDLLIDKETGEIVVPDVRKTLNLLEDSDQLLSGDINEIIENLDLNTINLTPQQLTLLQDVQKGIAPTEAQAEDALAALNTLQTGLVALVAAQTAKADARADTVSANIATDKNSADANVNANAAPLGTDNTLVGANNIAANNTVGANPNDASNTNNAQTANAAAAHKIAKEAPLPFSASDAPAEGDLNFEQILKNAAGKKYAGNPVVSDDAGTPNANAHNANNAASQAAFNVLQAWPFATAGSLYGPSSFSDEMSEQLGLSLNGGQSTAQGSLSALVSQAQSAGHPHPATQMVAATLTKGLKAGTDTNISLRLDPPGLGRVHVEMTFSKDKTMKAIVKAETPETFMMLQRDAQTLERALHGAGLDADSGLSFELAQNGEFTDHNNQRGGGHDSGGTGRGGNAGGEELEIIDSTMTWRVDPETGHTRYNIYA